MAREHSDKVTDIRKAISEPGVRRQPAPCLSYTVFINVLTHLMANPPAHNRVLLPALEVPSVSPTKQARAVGAMKFLGLIKDDGALSDEMVMLLVEPIGTVTWSDVLEPVVRRAYGFVFNSGVDLAEAGSRELERVFEPYRSTKGTLDDSIEFFRTLCLAADIKIRRTAGEDRAYRKRVLGFGHEEAEEMVTKLDTALVQVPEVAEPVRVLEVAAQQPLPGLDIKEETMSDKHRTLKEVLAKAASMAMDPNSYDKVIEVLSSVLPKPPPAPPAGPPQLPPLPHFSADWSEDVQSRWFKLYELQLNAALERDRE